MVHGIRYNNLAELLPRTMSVLTKFDVFSDDLYVGIMIYCFMPQKYKVDTYIKTRKLGEEHEAIWGPYRFVTEVKDNGFWIYTNDRDILYWHKEEQRCGAFYAYTTLSLK